MVRLAREIKSVTICLFLKGYIVVIHVEWESNATLFLPNHTFRDYVLSDNNGSKRKNVIKSEFKRRLLGTIAIQVFVLGILVETVKKKRKYY